jgi:hypothetical protein
MILFFHFMAILGFWTQHLLYHLSHAPRPFLLCYFSGRVMCFSQGLRLKLSYLSFSCIYSHEPPCPDYWLRRGRGVSLNFCPGCPWTPILPISASWVDGIIEVSHHGQVQNDTF